jgi:hypothetical protein
MAKNGKSWNRKHAREVRNQRRTAEVLGVTLSELVQKGESEILSGRPVVSEETLQDMLADSRRMDHNRGRRR